MVVKSAISALKVEGEEEENPKMGNSVLLLPIKGVPVIFKHVKRCSIELNIIEMIIRSRA